MKKLLFTAVALLITVFSTWTASAQFDLQAPVENDPELRTGVLTNGMTYFIRHNDIQKDRADFYFLSKVGAIQEAPIQDGLAHFQEHMCLNGSKNMPGKMMLDYFRSIGVSFGDNINASTGVEQTMYLLRDIPTIRQGIIDTALLTIHDYSGFTTNDPQEIDNERGVIIEEWRTRRTADWRMHEQILKVAFKGSKYADCTIIGTKENLETFPYSALHDFYNTWYRPDLQGIAVVGDIDVDAIEAQIKELFADIPARTEPNPKVFHQIPANEEPIIGIITDPEAGNTSIEVIYKGEPFPYEHRNTGISYLQELIESMISSMLNERFSDIAAKPDAPFIDGGCTFTNLTATCHAFDFSVNARNNESLTALKAALVEIEKAKKYGFTTAEFDRAKTSMLRYLESTVESASTRRNADYVNSILSSFFHGWAIPTPEKELELEQYLFSLFNVEAINQVMPQLIPENNQVIIYTAPEREGITHPTESDILSTLDEVKTTEIVANAEEAAQEPLLNPDDLKGSKVKRVKEGLYDSQIWTLKNGINVVVKPTELKKDEIRMQLYVDGGTSRLSAEELVNFESNVFSIYNSYCGVSSFPQTTLNKMLTGKRLNIYPFVSSFRHGVQGFSSPKDLETAMQLMYLIVTAPRFENEELKPGVDQLKAVLPNMENQPMFVIQNEFVKTLYNNNPRRFQISSAMLEKIDINLMKESYTRLYGNMKGATLVLVGDFNPEEIKPLVEKYIGSLPVGKAKNKWVDNHDFIAETGAVNHFTTPMTTPKATVLLYYHFDLPYSLESRLKANYLNNILNIVYNETIREQEGGTYGVGTMGDIDALPYSYGMQVMQYDTEASKEAKLTVMIKDELKKIAEQGPDNAYFTMVQENFLKEIPSSRLSNNYWLNNLVSFYQSGVDFDTDYAEMVKAITPATIQAFAAEVLNGRLFEVVMYPAE